MSDDTWSEIAELILCAAVLCLIVWPLALLRWLFRLAD